MADILALWNFDDKNLLVDQGSLKDLDGLATAEKGNGVALGGLRVNNQFTGFGDGGNSNFGWELTGWAATPTLDATDYFKFTVDTTDYSNIKFDFKERAKDKIAGDKPTQFAVAYQIGNGAIQALPSESTSLTTALVTHNYNFSTTTDLNDNASVSFYLYAFGASPTSPDGSWRIDDVTISGDVQPSKFSIAATDADKAEGSAGVQTPFTFTVTRTADIDTAASVSYTVTGSGINQATPGEDFFPEATTVEFGVGEASKTITVGVVGDTDAEQQEEFTVTLTDTTFGTIKTGTATGTIQNDDKAIAIAANADAVQLEGNEGTKNFTFTLTRTGDITATTSVQYAVSGAVDAADFGGTLPSGTATFAANEATTTISIPVSGDLDAEPAEQFTVTLSNPTGGEVLITPTATGTIQGDDNAFEIVTASASKFEGNSGTTPFTFTVNRYGDTTGTTSVGYTVAGSGDKPADAADFAATTGTVQFADGQEMATLTVDVVGDGSNEGVENFTVSLNNPERGEDFVVGKESAQGTILNDDATMEIIATDARKAEGNSETEKTAFTFTVKRGGDISSASSVNYVVQSAGINPVDVTDFGEAFPSGLLEFAAGEASKTITVEVAGDTVIEPNETFRVVLVNPSNGEALTTSIVLGTILNDDGGAGGGTGGGTGSGTGGGGTGSGTGGGGTGSGTDSVTGGGTDGSSSTGGVTNGGTDGSSSTGGIDGFTFAAFPAAPATTTAETGTADNETFSGDDAGNAVSGGEGSDLIAGFGGDDVLSGDAGSDEMYGNLGNDWMSGGDGDDLMFGGQGDDAILGGAGNDGIAGQIGNDRIDGGDGNDTLFGNVGDDSIQGNVGDDLILAGQGDDLAEGNAGNDTLSGDIGNDSLAGNDGNDILFGNAGDDLIKGGEGDDWLLGGKDNDTLIGGVGNDAMFGNLGDDSLIGGDGGDFFGFRSGDGSDIIADFQNGVDIIGLEATFSFTDVAITQVDADTRIVVGDLSITLQGVNATSISESDFAFVI